MININTNKYIKYTNVVSKKYKLTKTNAEAITKQFLTEIGQLNIGIEGPLFYSIVEEPEIGDILEVFLPITEDYVELNDELKFFHSYFTLENMISYTLCENIEENAEKVAVVLLDHIKKLGLIPNTPIFQVIKGDSDFMYVDIMIGTNKMALCDETSE